MTGKCKCGRCTVTVPQLPKGSAAQVGCPFCKTNAEVRQ